MATLRVHHHKLTVADMDQSLHFYRDLLELKLLYDTERQDIPAYDQIIGYPNVKLRTAALEDPDGAMLCLIEYRSPPVVRRSQENYFQGATGFSIEVDDIEADYDRLTAAGVSSRSRPVVIIRDGKAVAKAVYMNDPDGVTVELYQPIK